VSMWNVSDWALVSCDGGNWEVESLGYLYVSRWMVGNWRLANWDGWNLEVKS
jgi:hypothetical protein